MGLPWKRFIKTVNFAWPPSDIADSYAASIADDSIMQTKIMFEKWLWLHNQWQKIRNRLVCGKMKNALPNGIGFFDFFTLISENLRGRACSWEWSSSSVNNIKLNHHQHTFKISLSYLPCRTGFHIPSHIFHRPTILPCSIDSLV